MRSKTNDKRSQSIVVTKTNDKRSQSIVVSCQLKGAEKLAIFNT